VENLTRGLLEEFIVECIIIIDEVAVPMKFQSQPCLNMHGGRLRATKEVFKTLISSNFVSIEIN